MDNTQEPRHVTDAAARTTDDEGGLRAPPELRGWRKWWWWFDFIILVKLARLRFIAILVAIGVVITQWDTLVNYFEKWTRSGAGAPAGSGNVEYFCPMHPAIVRDNPKDKCPICFMPLSKRKQGGTTDVALPAGVVNRVQLSPYRVVLAGINTWTVDYLPLHKEIAALGYVEFNERAQATVSARVNGRIEKLYVNETGQMVDAGDPLTALYSPDLLVTVQTLLDAKKSNNQAFLENSRTRLRLLGIDDDQINEMLASGKPDSLLTIRSPLGGHVIKKYVREGQYVQEGMPLYDVADLSTVWIQAQVYEDDIPFLPVEQAHKPLATQTRSLTVRATTRAFPGDEFHGNLAFVYPHVDQETRTLTVRFELDNPGHKLRPGSTATVLLNIAPQDLPMLARADIDAVSKDMLAQGRVLAVPESAVIDTGKQRIVYRETLPGVYEGVLVELGPRMSGEDGVAFFPVLRGIAAGERIVTSGSFLVDAETRLNPAAGSIYFGGSGGAQGSSAGVTSVRPSTPADGDTKTRAALAKLTPEDRALAESQEFCAVLTDSRLGSMGVPVKVMIEGKSAFVCCAGCKNNALGDPAGTLRRVDELKAANKKTGQSAVQ